MKVIGLGDCCVDYYIHKKTAFPGGNAFNVAVYAKENGAEASFLGTVGDDEIGKHILKCAKELGIDVSHCPIKHGSSGKAAVNIIDGDRVFVDGYFGDTHGVGTLYPPMLSKNDIEYIEEHTLLHSSCYAHVEEQVLRLDASKLLLTFDFSMEECYRTKEYLREICPILDMALFSCQGRSREKMISFAKEVISMGCKNVLMTMGKAGQLLVSEQGFTCEGEARLITPVDTMGAGDSFFAAFLVQLLKMGWRKNLPLEKETVRKSLESAAEYSASVCMTEGSFGMGMEIEL